MNDKKQENELTYEQAFEKLESIVQKLDEGNLKLDEIEAQFEEGMKLAEYCGKRLEQIEKKVSLLIEQADGRLNREPFEDPEA